MQQLHKNHSSLRRTPLLLLASVLVVVVAAAALVACPAEASSFPRGNDTFFEKIVPKNWYRTGLQAVPFSKSVQALGHNCTQDTAIERCGESLVCADGVCSTCTSDTQCPQFNTCHKSNDGNYCAHKNLFPRIDIWDILSAVSSFVAGMLASSGGIGGGGLFVPLFVLLGRFPPHLAIPLSKAMIFGSAISNFIVYVRQRHPKANRPVIDFDMSLLMEPIILCGTIIGVFFNVMFPKWLIIILLIFVLGFTCYKTMQKGIQLWKTETKEKQKADSQKIEKASLVAAADMHDDTDEHNIEMDFSDNSGFSPDQHLQTGAVTSSSSPSIDTTVEKPEEEIDIADKNVEEADEHRDAVGNSGNTSPNSEEVERILAKESKTPWLNIILLAIAWVVVFVTVLLKGSHSAPSIIGIKECSPVYWLLVVIPFPLLIALSLFVAWNVRTLYVKKERLGYNFVEGDIRWTWKAVLLYPAFTLLAGISAALLGIGGGMVTSPLFLSMGVLPQVSAASSAFMILFTSSSATVQFALLGLLPWDYGIFFMVNGLVSAAIGQYIISWLVKKYQKTSLIVLSIGIVTGLSGILMGASGFYDVYADWVHGNYMGFKSPCN